MTVNISSRKVELLIGGQDWTKWIDPDSGIQVGYPEYEVGSGLLIAQGTINLKFGANYSLLPSNPYYRFNPSQWRRGQTVTIKVANPSGTLTYLPCSGGGLRIIKAPQPPTKEIGGVQKMSIQIGCKLALEYFPPEPNKDVSGVVAGTDLDIGVIINNILNFIGLNSAFSNIGYFINYPLPKTGGNWLQMAGQLAASAGRSLRCDVNGNVAGYLFDLNIGTAIANYLIGRDEQTWESIGDISEQPIEKLILTGVKTTVEPVDTDPTDVSVYDAYGALFPDAPPLETQVLKSRTITTIIPIPSAGTTGGQPSKKVQYYENFGVTYPDANPTNPNSGYVPLRTETIETYYDTRQGKTSFIINQVNLVEREARSAAFPDATPLSVYVFTKRETTTTWTKIKDGLWDKRIYIREARGITYPNLNPTNPDETLNLRSDNTVKDTSGPPTNIGGGEVSENTLKEEQIKAEVYAAQLAADEGRERQRTIAVPFATSISQLALYGDLYNKFLTGRAFGWRFGGAITDTALTFQPFQTVTVADGDRLYYLKLDALQYAISQTEALCFWHGIEVGTALVSAPTDISKPLEITLGRFEAIGLSDGFILYNPIVLVEAIGLTDGFILYNPIIPSEAIGRSY